MTLRFFTLIFASVCLIHYATSCTTTSQNTTAISKQNAKAAVQAYFEERNQCFIHSEDPLLVSIRADDDSSTWIDCTDGGDTQLAMNFCAAANACLEIRKMQAFSKEVLSKKPEKEQAFLKDLWKELQAVEQAAQKEGKKYEGGSMRPLIISSERTALLEKKRAALRAKWL